MLSTVTKRSGAKEPFDIDKIHKVLEWATDGINNVSISQIEMKCNVQLYEAINASEIHDLLIKSTKELITETAPNYQYVASRLVSYKLRKEIYGEYEPPLLFNIISKNIKLGKYDSEILDHYTKDEIDYAETLIKHKRDEQMPFVGIEQVVDKYLCQTRSNKEIYETPQIMYMMQALTLFSKGYKSYERMAKVKNYYESASTAEISLPSPVMAGVRTPIKQYSSCVKIEVSDDLNSINAGTDAVVSYVSKKAGIGIGFGSCRAEGSFVGDGTVKHTGVIPFAKYIQSALKSCSQGGIRGGAATVHFVLWHLDFEDLVVLKNNKGTEETRVRHMDYCFQINRVMYERLAENKDITLFSPHEVPDLYEAYFEKDVANFRTLYEKYEAKKGIRKKTMPAKDVFSLLAAERKNTSRIYIQNIDLVNSQSMFKDPVKMSNLCSEIAIPTFPLKSIDGGAKEVYVEIKSNKLKEWKKFRSNYKNIFPSNLSDEFTQKIIEKNDFADYDKSDDCTYILDKRDDEDSGSIALCTLGGVNWGLVNNPKDFEKPCYTIVEAIDQLIDHQDYPVLAAEVNTVFRRNLGIGMINLAYFLAKRGLTYSSPESLEVIDEYAQHWSYYLIRASVDLAIEKGPCAFYEKTLYADGIVPMDIRKKTVDELVEHKEYEGLDWDLLRSDLKEYGIRNSSLMALFPAETSALVSGATNGIEPPRSLVSYKESKSGSLPHVVPDIHKLKNKYELLWDQKDPIGYLNIVAILQKYVDQSISTNTSYNPLIMGEEFTLEKLLGDIVHCYRYGIKNLYYNNVFDDGGEKEEEETETTVERQRAEEMIAEALSKYLDEEEDCDSCHV